jgi:hypothetical protein
METLNNLLDIEWHLGIFEYKFLRILLTKNMVKSKRFQAVMVYQLDS